MHSRLSLHHDLRALGLAPGDTVMVHASMRAVGPIAGGPDQIHLAIKDALSADGTLLMYASCPEHYDEVGRGILTPEDEAELLEKLPAFDARTARSARDNGALVELLRTCPARRSTITSRGSWPGGQGTRLFAEQPWDYAFGARSALERFVALDGRILLLGSDHDTVTFLHYAEHVGDSRTRHRAFQVPVLESGGASGAGWRRSTRATAARTRTGPTGSSRRSSTDTCARRATAADAWARAELGS